MEQGVAVTSELRTDRDPATELGEERNAVSSLLNGSQPSPSRTPRGHGAHATPEPPEDPDRPARLGHRHQTSQIALCIPYLPTRRAVVETLIEHGYQGHGVQDIDDWYRGHRAGLAILAHGSHDLAEEIRRLTATAPESHIVALVDEQASDCADLLDAGARAVLDRTTASYTLVPAIRLVEAGYTVAHNPASTAMVSSRQGNEPAITLTEEEQRVLVRLAAGDTVTSIADDVGRSRRTMCRRLLAGLYAKLGVTGRDRALVVAARAGLVR